MKAPKGELHMYAYTVVNMEQMTACVAGADLDEAHGKLCGLLPLGAARLIRSHPEEMVVPHPAAR